VVTAGQGSPGTHARRGSAAFSRRDLASDLASDLVHLLAQALEGGAIRVPSRPEKEIAGAWTRKNKLSRQLAQATLQTIPTDDGEPEFRDDDRYACISDGRLEAANVDEPGFQFLTRPHQVLDVGGARYPARARKSEPGLRRRRTCRAVER
jgi:hypothetical protein